MAKNNPHWTDLRYNLVTRCRLGKHYALKVPVKLNLFESDNFEIKEHILPIFTSRTPSGVSFTWSVTSKVIFWETCTQSIKHSVQHSNKHPDRQTQGTIVQEVNQKGRRKTSESSFFPKSNEETWQKCSESVFSELWIFTKGCNNLRYVYSRVTAESQWEEWTK